MLFNKPEAGNSKEYKAPGNKSQETKKIQIQSKIPTVNPK
jgi:hypothetical protein